MTANRPAAPNHRAAPITRHRLDRVLDTEGWRDRVGARPGLWVDVRGQRLLVIHERRITAACPCSTARAGVGTREGSWQTPDGWHEVSERIGAGLPVGAILRGRVWTGACWEPGTAVEEDLVLSRILRLSGLELGHNRGEGIDSHGRFIYIHGTNAEAHLGRPVSLGCIRLSNADVIALFEQVVVGCPVLIR